MIRATLSAVPQRRLVLAAKAIVLGGVALIIGTIACLAAYFVFQVSLSSDDLRTSIGDPGVLGGRGEAACNLTVLGLLGLGLGALIRSSAGAIAALFGLLFVPTILAASCPRLAEQDRALPSMNAGDAIYSLHRDAASLSRVGRIRRLLRLRRHRARPGLSPHHPPRCLTRPQRSPHDHQYYLQALSPKLIVVEDEDDLVSQIQAPCRDHGGARGKHVRPATTSSPTTAGRLEKPE